MIGFVEQPAAKAALDEACLKWPRAWDAWEAVTWAIAHDLEKGEPITESGAVRVLESAGARSIGLPTVWVLYEIAHERVIVYEAKFSDAAYAQAGHA